MRTLESILASADVSLPSSQRLLAPLVTPDQRAEKRRWHRDYRRKLSEARKAKNEREGKFMIDLKAWIDSEVIEPGVNVLKYKDVDGVSHLASILPSGKLQADMPGGPVFLSVKQWLRKITNMAGPAIMHRLNWESKRVYYRHMPMSRWFRVYREGKANQENMPQEPENIDEGNACQEDMPEEPENVDEGTANQNSSQQPTAADEPDSIEVLEWIITIK